MSQKDTSPPVAAAPALVEHIAQGITALRDQAQDIPVINPPLVVAERLSRDFDRSHISLDHLQQALDYYSQQTIITRAQEGRAYIATHQQHDLAAQQKRLCQHYLQHQQATLEYGLVFTAHPIFALSAEDSQALAQLMIDPKAPVPQVVPLGGISLQEEHARAISALDHARKALLALNRTLYDVALEANMSLAHIRPFAFQLSTWVGYDLDGRDDILWYHSFIFRLIEKQHILAYYLQRIAKLVTQFPDSASSAAPWQQSLEREYQALQQDIQHFTEFADKQTSLEIAANHLTEREHLIDSMTLALPILQWASKQEKPAVMREWMLLGQEIQHYSFGVGRVHLRLNAVQIRNAMRSVVGETLGQTHQQSSQRQRLKQLEQKLSCLTPEEVNFVDLHYEAATATRLMILAQQIIKHVDSRQPIRLLIAECEQPMTLLAALYLAKQTGVDNLIDISPLFETELALERGDKIMHELLELPSYLQYVKSRQVLAVQMGFSDAGRFVGQLPASLAIERLQIKLADVHQTFCPRSVKLLFFNTHGESLGRGGARGATGTEQDDIPGIYQRQRHIFSPYARRYCHQAGISVIHESSFQGGDGYLWFQTPEIAALTITRLCEAELVLPEEDNDPFYQQHSFSLDLFLSIKRWQENLFSHPDYSVLLGMFGNHMLYKAGSRPTKRASSSAGGRQDPSKIRAIAHNALLQQYGYLANVAGGLGHASLHDLDNMITLYQHSARLRGLVDHALLAQRKGSINTLLAYAAILDHGGWIARAYQARDARYVQSCRRIANLLIKDSRADSIKRLAAVFRDDMLDLDMFLQQLAKPSIAPSGNERILIDSLQSLRLFLMIEIMVTICKLPRFAEHNATRREDVISMVLGLDINNALEIIEREFKLNEEWPTTQQKISEPGRNQRYPERYQEIQTKIVQPIRRMHGMIKQISLLIGCLYGAHG